MSVCPACRRDHPSGKKFCPACGARLTEAPASASATRPNATNDRSGRRWWTVGGAVAAALVAGGGSYLLTSRDAVVSRSDEMMSSPRPAVEPPAAVKADAVAAQPVEIERGPVEPERVAEAQPEQTVARPRQPEAPPLETERLKAEAADAERRAAAALFQADATKADSEAQHREEAAREAERKKAETEAQQRREEAAWVAAAEAERRRPAEEQAAAAVELPAGLEMNVRLSTKLNSGNLHVEDRFEATTQEELKVNGRSVVPAGSIMRGIVSSVEPASHTNRTARMTLAFDQLTVNGQAYPIRARVTQAIAGQGLKGEATRIAVGAGIGAVVGGLFGGGKGAAAGTVIGSGGTIAATEGKQIELPQGAIVRATIDAPVQIQVR